MSRSDAGGEVCLSNSLVFIDNLARYREAAKVYTHHSARVQCWRDKGVLYGDYSGVLSLDACKYLGENLQRLAGPMPTFESLHRAVTMPFNKKPCLKHFIGTKPGCFIVRPDQYELMTELSGALAANGVVRLTFLESQIHHAQHWIAQFH